jgi:anthranilate phosphoribosyltransferase
VFLFAPYFHPAMARVKDVRRELGVRTIFNLLGPLCNPAGVSRQVIGVYAPHLMTLLGDVAVATGSKQLLMVHSQDGMDEFSISAPTNVREWTGTEWREYLVTPELVGLKSTNRAALTADSVEASAAVVRDVLTGRSSGARDVAVMNAAAFLYVGGKVHSIEEGVQSLKELFATGTVSKRIEHIIRGAEK